jgi:hypothetical protein
MDLVADMLHPHLRAAREFKVTLLRPPMGCARPADRTGRGGGLRISADLGEPGWRNWLGPAVLQTPAREPPPDPVPDRSLSIRVRQRRLRV